MSGKIREKSGKFEVDEKWQPCFLYEHKVISFWLPLSYFEGHR